MTASAPSRTALVTSVTSARVGRGEDVIDSSISVAVIESRALAFVRDKMSCWAAGTLSKESSTPRSPLATMAPAASSRMSSRFRYPMALSILAMTGVPWASFFTIRTSSPDDTKLDAT